MDFFGFQTYDMQTIYYYMLSHLMSWYPFLEGLLHEMKKIWLSWSGKLTKILKYYVPEEDATINVIEISEEFIKILDEEESHRYLGRQVCTCLSDRINIEFKNRARAAWTALPKHKCVLMDLNLSLRLRFKIFIASINPALMFRTPIWRGIIYKSSTYYKRKMMMRIVGCRRIDEEDWKKTMKRMNDRLEQG